MYCQYICRTVLKVVTMANNKHMMMLSKNAY